MLTDAIDRRTALGGLAALLGVASLPASALAVPSGKPSLPTATFRLLGAVADTILPATDTPGALAAKVPARIDAMIANWAAPKTRTALLGVLQRIDSAALSAKGKPFASLTPDDRRACLLPLDAAALATAPAGGPPRNPYLALRSGRPVVDEDYRLLKQLVINLYYFSPEATATELVYEHVPGKYEPSLKLTAGSRPFLDIY